MKAVILAGGLGTRLSEETSTRSKLMIEIGGKPILWHILKTCSHHGINDLVICCGYKGYVIKEYFANYLLHMSDVTFDISKNSIEVHQRSAEPWRVTFVDTGDDTMTGCRVKRIAEYVKDDEAKAIGMTSVGLLGRDGGQLRALFDCAIVVPSDVTARIQESHNLIGHTLCGLIEPHLGLA